MVLAGGRARARARAHAKESPIYKYIYSSHKKKCIARSMLIRIGKTSLTTICIYKYPDIRISYYTSLLQFDVRLVCAQEVNSPRTQFLTFGKTKAIRHRCCRRRLSAVILRHRQTATMTTTMVMVLSPNDDQPESRKNVWGKSENKWREKTKNHSKINDRKVFFSSSFFLCFLFVKR